jgi:hypothetical protein
MEGLASITGAVVTIGFVAIPAIAMAWALSGRDGSTLADLFRIRLDESWPRGVQEDEPVRWKLDAFEPGRYSASAPGARPAPHASSGRTDSSTGLARLQGGSSRA